MNKNLLKKYPYLKKYTNGGSNYGQIEYGDNTATLPTVDAATQLYLNANESAYKQSAEKETAQRDLYLNELNAYNDQETIRNLEGSAAKLLNDFRTAKGSTIKEKLSDQFKPNTLTSAPFNADMPGGGQAFTGTVPKGTTSVYNASTGQGMSLAPGVAPKAGEQIIAKAPSMATQSFNAAVQSSKTLSATANLGNTISPYALAAYAVGEGVGHFANDDDETTWTGGEIAGDLLSSTASGVGTGATIGSIFGPPGAGIGAVVGGIYGFGKGIYEGVSGTLESRGGEAEWYDEQDTALAGFRKGQRDASVSGNESFKGYYHRRDGGIKPMNSNGDMIVYGPTHEQGGVMRDPKTELEGGGIKNGKNLPGEVITKVADASGTQREYYFSDHLKNPSTGNTFAEDYINTGGMNYNAKQMFAKLQEQVAGRTDSARGADRIAKHGGYNMHQEGNFQVGDYTPTRRDSINFELLNIKTLYEDLHRQGKFDPKSPDYQGDTRIRLEKDRKVLLSQLNELGPLENITEAEKSYQEAGFKDYTQYGSWEEGAQDNPQSELWMGKPNIYANPSAQVVSKMHAGQSKKIESMAKQLLKKAMGGYNMHQEGDFQYDDVPAATVNLPEVVIRERAPESAISKLLDLRGLQRELEFLNGSVLSRTPLGGDTGAETAMNIASLSPLGMGRLGVLNTGKYLRKLSQPFKDAMTYTNIGRRGKAGKEVVGKPLPTFEDIYKGHKTIRVPSTGGTGANVGPGSVLSPRSGTTTRRMVKKSPDGKKTVVEYTGPANFPPATIPSQRQKHNAKNTLDRIRKFTKANKTDITLLSGALTYDAMSNAYNESERAKEVDMNAYEEAKKALVKDINEAAISPNASTLQLSDVEKTIMEGLRSGEYTKADLAFIKKNVSPEVQSVIDSVASSYAAGGLRKYQPGGYNDSPYLKDVLSNWWAKRQHEAQAPAVDTAFAQVPNLNAVVPQTSLPDANSIIHAVKALPQKQVNAMSDEEFNNYMSASQFTVNEDDQLGINIPEVAINEDKLPAMPVNFNPNRDMTSGPVVQDPTAGMREITLPGTRSRLEDIMNTQSIADLQALTGLSNPSLMVNDDLRPRSLTAAEKLKMAATLENERRNFSLDEVQSTNLLDDPLVDIGEEEVSDWTSFDSDWASFYKEIKNETPSALARLSKKLGLGDITSNDIRFATDAAVTGLALAKANKTAKELGELELEVKGDIEAKHVPKQNISMEAEKKKVQEDANAMKRQMLEQGKSTAEVIAAQSEANSAIEKIGTTEKNLQAQADLKVDSMNASLDFKEQASNKQVELEKAMADLDISAAEKQNRLKIWEGLKNTVLGMNMDARKMQSAEKQMNAIAESLSKSEALNKTYQEMIDDLIANLG